MQTVKENVTSEIIVKNSRFIAELFPCTLQSDVRNLIKNQKKLYKDARHVVHAFIIGSNAEIKGASDDGEPSGTAGRPILSVLQGNNFTNVLLTVTRYFGGTLLGTGGLVKAYSDAAKLVIKNALDNGLSEELISLVHFSFSTDYANYEKIKRLFKDYPIQNVKESFNDFVSVDAFITKENCDIFFERVKNITDGKVIPLS